jgi:two-component system cell cycle response regulator DivK
MKRILYVEDNDDNVFMLRMRLELAGDYEVLVAPDGAQGVVLAATAHPDVILMDLNLPVMDGWEATRRIKAEPASARVPVIALTAHAMSGDREKAMEAGCDDFDTKPVDFERLLAKIEGVLASGDAREGSPLQSSGGAAGD